MHTHALVTVPRNLRTGIPQLLYAFLGSLSEGDRFKTRFTRKYGNLAPLTALTHGILAPLLSARVSSGV